MNNSRRMAWESHKSQVTTIGSSFGSQSHLIPVEKSSTRNLRFMVFVGKYNIDRQSFITDKLSSGVVLLHSRQDYLGCHFLS